MAAEHETIIRKALKHGQEDKAAQAIEAAFADENASEEVLAWSAGVAYENKLAAVLGVLPEFLGRFPESLHMIRVYYADLCAGQEHFDMATTHGRLYIRLVREAQLLDQLPGHDLIQEGVGRSFLLTTSAYTELGARSYSRRLLKFGLEHEVHDSWKDSYKQELDRLAKELKDGTKKNLDSVWERFFKKGKGADDVVGRAKARSFVDMTTRLKCLEALFHRDKNYRIDAEEMLQVVGHDENGATLLT